MLRPFLTRLPNFLTRTVLLVPCLLVCLACATPFPIEKLEEGMTKEIVRETFGEPVATDAVWDPPGAPWAWNGTWTYEAKSSWTYPNEEQDWSFTYNPLTPLMIPLHVVVGELWKFDYVIIKPVVLHFEGEKLARWEVIEPVPVVSSGYNANGEPFSSTMTFHSKDAAHHARGHDHHHGC